MSDTDRLKEMRPELVKRFRHVVNGNVDELNCAMKSGKLNAVAWLTRNLLELAIWSSYCLRSEGNAKQFVLDSARDLHDAMDVPDGILSQSFSFREARAESIANAKQDGFETLDENYKAVSAVARELGHAQEFRTLNKMLSKFAHPTALAVIFDNDQVKDRFREKFYAIGLRLAEETLKMLDGALLQA